jgi:putative addiction module killer protein
LGKYDKNTLINIIYYSTIYMTIWNIEYWHSNKSSTSSLEEVLKGLTKEQLKSVAKEVRLLELCGNELRLPHSRALGDGLFELRERNFGYRIYYSFLPEKLIILLHAGDKSKQSRDIKIARQRLLELMRD